MSKKILLIILTILTLGLVLYLLPKRQIQSDIKIKLGEKSNSESEMWIFKPTSDINTGKTLLICPGGSYSGLAIEHEGREFAQWLASIGITGVVLKYELPQTRKEVPLNDVRQAIIYLRTHTDSLNINSGQIGIAGFSAGGHLAATTSTLLTDSLTRPDYTVLFYPVITMEGSTTHWGSRRNLLGQNPSEEELEKFSAEKQVTENTPPAIIFVSEDDIDVLPENSKLYNEALKKCDVPVELYTYPTGGHGFGMRTDVKHHKEMLTTLEKWLKKEIKK